MHAVPVHIDGNGVLATRTIDLSIPEHRHWIAKEGQPHPAFHRCPFAIGLRKPGARLAHTSAVGAE